MKYNETKGVSISELSLGTVQLGVSYGINNQSGKPDRTQAFGILDTALTNGISALDTAAAYGDSEQSSGSGCRRYRKKSGRLLPPSSKHSTTAVWTHCAEA